LKLLPIWQSDLIGTPLESDSIVSGLVGITRGSVGSEVRWISQTRRSVMDSITRIYPPGNASFSINTEICSTMLILVIKLTRVMSHVQRFGGTASRERDVLVSNWRSIISFRDMHLTHSYPHLQISGYVTLLNRDPRTLRTELPMKFLK
jgi:hypothetical protein